VIQARNLTLNVGQLEPGQRRPTARRADLQRQRRQLEQRRPDRQRRQPQSEPQRQLQRHRPPEQPRQPGLSAGYIGLGATADAGGGAPRVSSSGSLNNSGRLTSAADLKLSAASLNNDGTLGSAGALRIEAANLLNHNGLIFSGGDMALRVGSFSNRYADVYSLGALDIAADDQGNWASSVLNSSGSLESVGDFSLRAATISNTREGLSVNDLGVYTARITELACDHRRVGDCEGSNRNGIFEVVQRRS
jgi:filamentous hemagglutinin